MFKFLISKEVRNLNCTLEKGSSFLVRKMIVKRPFSIPIRGFQVLNIYSIDIKQFKNKEGEYQYLNLKTLTV